MRKTRVTGLVLAFLLSILCVTGCSKETVYVPVTTNTIEITEDGRVIGYMVEPFDKEYYDLSELDTMVREEIAEYNTSAEAGQSPIVVDKVAMAEDGSKNVVVALSFLNAAVYADYMKTEFFIGTVEEAIVAGYDLDKKLSKVKSGELLTGDLLQKNKGAKILVLKNACSVRLPNEVQFISGNVQIDANGFADCTAGEGLKYIIIK